MRQRADCTEWVERGTIRINRQPTDKAHAKVRTGDVLTVPMRGDVRVVRVLALASRRGSPADALSLYEDLSDPPPSNAQAASCAGT